MATSNNPREKKPHLFVFSGSLAPSTETGLWELVAFGCAACEGQDVYLIYEAEECDTDYFKKRDFSDVPA